MARMLVRNDEAARRCGVCSMPEDAVDEVVEAAHGAAGLQPSRAAPLVEMPGRDGLLPRYTLGERSRELRQRSVLLLWRAQRLRTRSTLLLRKHAGPAARVTLTACPPVVRSHMSSHTSQYPPRRGEGHVHWLYVGETLRPVLALACSDDTLPHRLASAYRAMDMLTPDDFPDDELRAECARLVHAWRPGESGGAEGTVAPLPAVLSPDQVRAIAEKLLLLYTEITQLEERHYNSLPLRDR